MHRIIIDQFGMTLGKKSERLIVRARSGELPKVEYVSNQLQFPFMEEFFDPPFCKPVIVSDYKGTSEQKEKRSSKSRTVMEIPFFRVHEIVIASRGVSISTDLIEELCERGIRVTFLTGRGNPYAMLSSPMLTATVITRREQISAYWDERGLAFSKKIVAGKIKNQAALLKYFGKYLKSTDEERYEIVNAKAMSLTSLRRKVDKVEGGKIDDARHPLLGLEGTAGRIYWEGVSEVISDHALFTRREHRGATDPVNSMLNYGYGILYSVIWGAIVNAGLEPFAGFLHVDRPGKPSLVLDLIEEFRQSIVDRQIFATVNHEQRVTFKEGLLDQESRRMVADKVLERLDCAESYHGKKYKLSSIIQMQARCLAIFLRKEGEYKPYSSRW
jgi:CRISPR-associated protein Cas1